jgi:hypothetical protein
MEPQTQSNQSKLVNTIKTIKLKLIRIIKLIRIGFKDLPIMGKYKIDMAIIGAIISIMCGVTLIDVFPNTVAPAVVAGIFASVFPLTLILMGAVWRAQLHLKRVQRANAHR